MSGRVQCGFFHVWFRGNSRFRIFYGDEDFIGFLLKCNTAAKRWDSKITAFALMDNHVHLQVYTQNLTLFISAMLISFTRWLNRRKAFTGRLFETPFSSSPIYSQDLLERNILYILTNPVRAGMCQNMSEYPWTSYHLFEEGRSENLAKSFKTNDHTSCNRVIKPLIIHNGLSKYIKIDNSVILNFFSTKAELNRKAQEFLISREDQWSVGDLINKENLIKEKIHGSTKPSQYRKRPDHEIIKYLNVLLKGRQFVELSNDEQHRIVNILRHREGANMLQIALILHESYYDIRKMCFIREEKIPKE